MQTGVFSTSSVHWEDECGAIHSGDTWKAHTKLIRTTRKATKCAKEDSQDCDAVKWVAAMKAALEDVFANHTMHLNDTPYGNAAKYILASPYLGHNVEFLMSWRKPEDWALDRRNRPDVVCGLDVPNPLDLLSCAESCTGSLHKCLVTEKSLFDKGTLADVFAKGQNYVERAFEKTGRLKIFKLFESLPTDGTTVDFAERIAAALKAEDRW